MVEVDPNGILSGAPGAKFDANKIDMSCLSRFGLALLAIADLSTFGKDKYTKDGWASVENGIERYEAAGLGHYFRKDFEDEDSDSKQPHEVCAAWNMLAALQLLIEENAEWKDRLMRREARTVVKPSVKTYSTITGEPNSSVRLGEGFGKYILDKSILQALSKTLTYEDLYGE